MEDERTEQNILLSSKTLCSVTENPKRDLNKGCKQQKHNRKTGKGKKPNRSPKTPILTAPLKLGIDVFHS